MTLPTFANFYFAKLPPIYFGAGKLSVLPKLLKGYSCQNILLVTGGQSLAASGYLATMQGNLEAAGIRYQHIICEGEPTPALIDSTCEAYRQAGIQGVVAIGGGSVVDAGKAISAMLPHQNSIMDHLEGVGRGIPHSGSKVPFVAIPTTSGTGSEVTKNAVISEVGPNGFKKSIRHDNLIPDAVIVDSHLLVTCPQSVTAACGMDAFTQLLEPYLSPTASPLTNALAWSGLEALAPNLLAACGEGAQNLAVREAVAYGALMSGACLANAGLGIVHGLASPLGAHFPIPHGVVCGTLMAAAVEANWQALMERDPNSGAIAKLARLGKLLVKSPLGTDIAYGEALVALLKDWTVQLNIPRLGEYGVRPSDLDNIVQQSRNRNNPIELSATEIKELVASRL